MGNEHVAGPPELLATAERAALRGSPRDAVAPLGRLLDPHAASPAATRSGSGGWSPERRLALRARARWLSGVALGALGRYGDALAALEPLIGADPAATGAPPSIAAAAGATAASLLRQIGDHPAAEPLDQRALDLLSSLGSAREGSRLRTDPVVAEVTLDCLIGSTADAVGLGDLPTATARLERAATAFADSPDGSGDRDPYWRPAIRLRWVETEVALLAGDVPTARRSAQAAVRGSENAASPRHLTKSLMFAGVAEALSAADGSTSVSEGDARTLLLRGAVLADEHGLLPLIWPLRSVLATMPGLSGPAEAAEHLDRARQAARAIAADLPPARFERWTDRDPMAAFLLDAGRSA